MFEGEDVYSIIYSALRHPIRRRILIMLSEKPRIFTEMQDVLGIESSHLTYHLDFLGELISKAEDGGYELSAFGEVAVSMMGNIRRPQEGKGLEKITRYWLPFEDASFTGSIAVDKDDVWFYTNWFLYPGLGQGLGQIKLKDSETEFNHYFLITRQRESKISIEKGMYRQKQSWRGLGGGIAAHDGYVWYGEQEGIIQWRRMADGGRNGRQVPEKQALCKMHTDTHRVMRYLFTLPDESSFPSRLDLDSSGRRVWGITQQNNARILDITTKKLKVLTVGKFVERRRDEHIVLRPEHRFRDVVVEPNGKRGWISDVGLIIDYNGALFLVDIEDGKLLKYPLKGFLPKRMALGPDGKIWCTSNAPIIVPVRNVHQHHIDIGLCYILCLDPNTNELTSYLVPHGLALPEGIIVTDEGKVWFGFGLGRHSEGGLSRLNPEKAKGSKTVITPEEPEEWELKEYDVTEAKGEEISPNTFELAPDKPIKPEYLKEFQTSHYDGFLNYSIIITTSIGRDLAQDSQGRIWFTTGRGGYIGVLTP